MGLRPFLLGNNINLSKNDKNILTFECSGSIIQLKEAIKRCKICSRKAFDYSMRRDVGHEKRDFN